MNPSSSHTNDEDPVDLSSCAGGSRRSFHNDRRKLLRRSMSSTSTDLGLQNSLLYNKEPLFVGRGVELGKLREAYERTQVASTSSTAELVLLYGITGIGKKSLYQALKGQQKSKKKNNTNSFWLSGKFEQQGGGPGVMPPLSGLLSVVSTLCEELLFADECLQKTIGESFTVSELQTMMAVVPAMDAFMSAAKEYENRSSISFETANTCMADLFARFIQTVAAPHHSVVIFLENIQWMDDESIAVVETLLSGKHKSHNLLLIATIRTDEDEAAELKLLHTDFSVSVTQIELDVLLPHHVHDLVAMVLSMESSQATSELAQVVAQRTGGSPLFILQFLELLFTKRMLKRRGGNYEWDIQQIREQTSLVESVVQVYTQRISSLREDLRVVLMTASILGFSFPVDILERLIDLREYRRLLDIDNPVEEKDEQTSVHKSIHVQRCLRRAARVGLIEAVPGGDGDVYKFCHDRIQQSANSLLPQGEEGARIKGKIGEVLLTESQSSKSADSQGNLLFAATNMLLIHPSSVEDDDIAQLCLQAARKASKNASFGTAAKYADAGMQKLGRSLCSTDYHYDLGLELCSTSVEMHYADGNMKTCSNRIATIKYKARCLKDQFRALRVLVDVCISQNDWERACEECRNFLNQLGVEIPLVITKKHISCQNKVVRRLLRGRSPAQLKDQLPKLNDPVKNEACRVLGSLAAAASYSADTLLMTFALNTLVEHTLTNGVGTNSGLGLVAYATLLNTQKDFKNAYLFSEAAIEWSRPTKDGKSNFSLSRSIGHHCYNHCHFAKPLIDCLSSCQEAYAVAISIGDIRYACYTLRTRCSLGLYAGTKLSDLEREIDGYQLFMIRNKQVTWLQSLNVQAQYISNMLGKSADPLKLTGKFMDEAKERVKSLGPDSTSKQHLALLEDYHFIHILLLYICGEFERVEKEIQLFEKYQALSLLHSIPKVFSVFICGLNSFAMAKQDHRRRRKHMAAARAQVSTLKSLAVAGAPVVQHMLLLLNAERLSVNGKGNSVLDTYVLGISQAREDRCLVSVGIGCERAGDFLASVGRIPLSRQYYRQAYEAFQKYGATMKLRLLETRHGSWIRDEESQHSTPASPVRRRRSLIQAFKESPHQAAVPGIATVYSSAEFLPLECKSPLPKRVQQ